MFRCYAWVSFFCLFIIGMHAASPAKADKLDDYRFSLPYLFDDSQSLSLDEYQGFIVLIDFWASWCAPCRVSLPLLDELRSRYQHKGFEVISINLNPNPNDAVKFLKRYPVNYPVVFDGSKTVSKQFHLKSIPSSYLMNQNGEVVFSQQGFNRSDIQLIESQIQELLGEIPQDDVVL